MKIQGFKKGMNQIAMGKRFELKDAIKKALGVNTDRTVELYATGKWAICDEKAEAVANVFQEYGITDWFDSKIEDTELCAESAL